MLQILTPLFQGFMTLNIPYVFHLFLTFSLPDAFQESIVTQPFDPLACTSVEPILQLQLAL